MSGASLGIDALKGKVVHIPVDKIAVLIEFNSFDEVTAYIEEE